MPSIRYVGKFKQRLIFKASSGNGRSSDFASSHGARIQTSRSSTHRSSESPAWPWDGFPHHRVRRCREKPIDPMRAWRGRRYADRQ